MKTCADTTCPCDEPVRPSTCPDGRTWCYSDQPCMDCRVRPRLVLVPDLKENP